MQHRPAPQHRSVPARSPRGGDARTAALTMPLALPGGAAPAARRSPAALRRRPGVYLGVAAAGAVLVNLLIGVDPAAQAEAEVAESVSVAQALGLTAQDSRVAAEPDLQPLSELAAGRGSRDAAEAAAQQAQAAADQAVLEQQRLAAEAAAAAQAQAEAAAAAARAAEEAAAAAAAAEAAEAAQAQAAAPAPRPAAAPAPRPAAAPAPRPAAAPAPRPAAAAAGTAAGVVARITNNAGPVSSRVQAAANAVVSNVPGAGSISLGGTRPSAADPAGHPSGNALDYMVMSNASLGDAIVAYHVAHWNELGVDYLIWEQRILQSPGGSWSTMSDRGGVTANHFDHVHVNYD